MRITLHNSFHNTQVNVIAGKVSFSSWGPFRISAKQLSRARKKLCGMADCQCQKITRATDSKGIALNFVDLQSFMQFEYRQGGA